MEQNTHVQVNLNGVHFEDEDILTGICFEYGASGVSEELEFTQKQDNYEPKTKLKRFKNLVVYFESEIDKEFFAVVAEKYPRVKVSQKVEENRDWNEEWKKGFTSFELSQGYWVVPSWEQPPAKAKGVIKIDPGMAFGTGTHATTQMAAELLIDLCHSQTIHTMIDVGSGTGILAILAQLLGVKSIQATEIDNDARRVGGENFQLNKANDCSMLEIQIEEVQDEFQLVVANIIDGVLTHIQEDLKRVLAYKGYMILTGILSEREETFLNNFIFPRGYKVIRRLEKDEWVGLLVGIGQ